MNKLVKNTYNRTKGAIFLDYKPNYNGTYLYKYRKER